MTEATRLTHAQQTALDELLRLVPPAGSQTASTVPALLPSLADLLQVWLGVSPADLKTTLSALLARKDRVEAKLVDLVERNPLDAVFEFLLAAAWVFYQAEKDANPRAKTIIDAFYYIATCASVGYADIFAATQPGRAIATLVMVLGPALTNKALDRPVASLAQPVASEPAT